MPVRERGSDESKEQEREFKIKGKGREEDVGES